MSAGFVRGAVGGTVATAVLAVLGGRAVFADDGAFDILVLLAAVRAVRAMAAGASDVGDAVAGHYGVSIVFGELFDV